MKGRGYSRVLGRVDRACRTTVLTLTFGSRNYGFQIRAALAPFLVAIGSCGARSDIVRELLRLVNGGLLNVGAIDIHVAER